MDKKKLNSKICIVGAGPSGISTAWYLQSKGYNDITILEKEGRVGGKCFSPIFRGKHFEMGAGIGEPDGTTQEFMDISGAIPDGESPHVKDRDAKSGEKTGSFPFLKEEEMIELKKQMGIMKELLETKYKGYDKPGHANCHPELMESFEDFCDISNVPLCKHAWLKPYTSFGYGYFNNIPAAYVLKYMNWDNMMYLAKGEYLAWENGTQELWEKAALKLNRYPRFLTDIKSIVRKNNKVYVESNYGREEYDIVIFTSPLQHLHKYVDLCENEKQLFSKIKTMDFRTYGFVPENNPEHSAFINGNLDISKKGHAMLYYNRWEKDEEQIITAYIIADEDKKIGNEECLQMLKEDMEIQEIGIKDIVIFKIWEYFPHISSFHMKQGWYDNVETIQGENNTYYAGEIMNFSNMEQCIAYSKNLVERFF